MAVEANGHRLSKQVGDKTEQLIDFHQIVVAFVFSLGELLVSVALSSLQVQQVARVQL